MSTNGKVLDTNAVVALFNEDRLLKTLLAGSTLYLPIIVVGELYYGAYKSGKFEINVQRLKQFLSQNVLLNDDEVTGDIYGQIKNALKTKGRPLPENDIWIAAIARQHNLPVVTRDAHFSHIDHLQIEGW